MKHMGHKYTSQIINSVNGQSVKGDCTNEMSFWKQKEGSQATPLISFPLITSQHRSESWFEWFHWWGEPKALKHHSDRPPLRQAAKVMPYYIWHPKAWEIDPPVWPLIGLRFEHELGQRIEGRVKSKMCAWLRSFVMGIDELPPWGRLEQSGHAEHSRSLRYVCIGVHPQYVILCLLC